MKMVLDFKERAESVWHQGLTKEAMAYAKAYGLQLQVEYPDPVCVTKEGEATPEKKINRISLRDMKNQECGRRLENRDGKESW